MYSELCSAGGLSYQRNRMFMCVNSIVYFVLTFRLSKSLTAADLHGELPSAKKCHATRESFTFLAHVYRLILRSGSPVWKSFLQVSLCLIAILSTELQKCQYLNGKLKISQSRD
jgi:hypothetical protein